LIAEKVVLITEKDVSITEQDATVRRVESRSNGSVNVFILSP
jgi:hypothetical protein